MASWSRIIAHVDLDAFFAAIEIRDDPSLAGKPVVVGGDAERRGVVSAASYPARTFGIHSAMPMARAVQLCPDLVVIPGNLDKYRTASDRLREVLAEFSPLLEPLSLDEAFLDLTGTERTLGPPERVGADIRRRVREALRITGSVGISSSKFVAKLASDHEKPDGLTVVPPDEVVAFVQSLPLERLWGVGPATLATLQRAGIRTIAELATADPVRLARDLGTNAARLVRLARGEDDRPVIPWTPAKSISHETTFARDVADEGTLAAVLLRLAEKVARRARRQGVAGRTVVLKLRYGDFTTYARRHTLPTPTGEAVTVFRTARDLLASLERGERPVRLLGVGIANLVTGTQLELGLDAPGAQSPGLQEAEDAVVRRFGRQALSRARTLLAAEAPDTDTLAESPPDA